MTSFDLLELPKRNSARLECSKSSGTPFSCCRRGIVSYLDEAAMRDFLGRSISSFNENKLHGIFAEIDFRNYLTQQGFADRVSPGGWIARSRAPNFGANTVVLFPEPIVPGRPYPVGRELPTPSVGLHSICATFYQIGISSYYLIPSIEEPNNTNRV